ncbi:MAG: choice-of-anchor K domain-containing protein, partial [Verrucomicrobiota bacterium]
IDPRVTIRAIPADSPKARAIFNPGSQRFETVADQEGFEFVLDDSLSNAPAVTEARDQGAVNYARNGNWVWDHTSTSNPVAPPGPSLFGTDPTPADSIPGTSIPPTVVPPSGSGAGGTPTPPDPEPPKAPRLETPKFNKKDGSHPEDDFPLSVAITNLPPAADADPFFRVGTSSWEPYSGSVSVEMNETLRAYFKSKDTTRYRDSSERHATFHPVPESLSGSVDGDFRNPSGGANLASTISPDGDRFEHGNPTYILDGEPVESGDPNVMKFSGKAFSDVAPGERFKLGDFYYHNGNSYYDSHATTVELHVTISLTDRDQTVGFKLPLELVNTENDPDDPQASADYVKIGNLQQNIGLKINGVSYRIRLGFGATDSFGFSTNSTFHVYEGATGSGELLGTFLAN